MASRDNLVGGLGLEDKAKVVVQQPKAEEEEEDKDDEKK